MRIKLGIGPMSKEIINCLNSFSKKNKTQIMLIASRNQIDIKEFGGGYVNSFNTKNYANYIKSKKNKYLIMARDHCGPYTNSNIPKTKSLINEIENTKKTLFSDIQNDFKLIHIDTSLINKRYKYKVAKDLINFCNITADKLNKKIEFEFGCEEHGLLRSVKAFKDDLKFLKQFKNIRFIVCQTGSLVKSVFQVGQFDFKNVPIMKKLASKQGIQLKEHNCDYLNFDQIKLRKSYKINALNIAPEFGYIQSLLTLRLCKKYRIKEFNNFYKYVIKKKSWQKWDYNNENNEIKFLSSAHYHFNAYIYRKILKKINKYLDFEKKLYSNISYRLKNYLI
ncbi:hypothetical protein N9337_06655 [Candidatus Pelagibacter sp.]|nr:hypothetical protein [Candidatus Pelagibacter sp.]